MFWWEDVLVGSCRDRNMFWWDDVLVGSSCGMK